MPNRVLKESIKRSPQIDALTWFEEVVFYRLLVTADDYGRYYGSPIILRNDLFPTKESITRKSIEDALRKLEANSLLKRYTVDGTQYVQLTTWSKHQRVRDSIEKFPSPQFAATCGKLPQKSAVIQIQSESQSKSERENAPAPARGELRAFGKFQNVMLSEAEHQALCEMIPNAADYIDRFSAKLAAKGYDYKNHYAAILSWYIDDKKQEPDSSFNIDDFWQAALNRTYGGTQ